MFFLVTIRLIHIEAEAIDNAQEMGKLLVSGNFDREVDENSNICKNKENYIYKSKKKLREDKNRKPRRILTLQAWDGDHAKEEDAKKD